MSFMLIGFTGTISQQARGAKKKKIKEALSLEKIKAQAKLHHVVAERNKANFKEKDSKMLNEI